MSNYEWIMSLPAEKLAEFLENTGAENLAFCDDYCPESETCNGDCKYRDEKAVWKKWLDSERKTTVGDKECGE